jgi:hypothetical protein
MSPQDRRRSRRAPVAWPVRVEGGGLVVDGAVVEVGMGGARLALVAAPPAVGQPVSLRLWVPRPDGGTDVVVVQARVVRHTADGAAVEYERLPDSVLRWLRPRLAQDPRRRALRARRPLPAVLERDGGAQDAVELADLSAYAARVASGPPLERGDQVTLVLEPGGGSTLRLPAVVWETGDGGALLMFVNLEPALFARLGDWVSLLVSES